MQQDVNAKALHSYSAYTKLNTSSQMCSLTWTTVKPFRRPGCYKITVRNNSPLIIEAASQFAQLYDFQSQ